MAILVDELPLKRRPTLTERAYREIKEMILRYQLRPGSPLKFGELTRALKMSQTPIREALSMLERERLVLHQGMRGYLVRPLEIREFEELYELRTVLEVAAVRQAALRISQESLDELTDLLNKVDRLLPHGDKGPVLELEQRFHAIILEASGNRLLAETGLGLLDRIWMIQNFDILTSQRWVLAHQQHRAVYEALRIGDGERAATLMAEHLRSATASMLGRLRDAHDILSRLVAGRA